MSQESWTRKEICRVLSLDERQLRSWEKQKLIEPAEQYAFADLLTLRTLLTLREQRVPSQRIRKTLESARTRLGVANPLAQAKVFAEGKNVRMQISGQHIEPLSGQLLFNFDTARNEPTTLQPRADRSRSREQADFWFQKGLELEQSGGPVEEAIVAYQKAVELNPHAAGALVNLGTIYFHQRDWKRSEAAYRAAVEADPQYALAHYNLGNLYDERNDIEQALQHYHQALKLQPQYADAHYNLALLHQGQGEMMKALGHWQTYLKLDPASQWAQIARREVEKIKKTTIVGGTKKA